MTLKEIEEMNLETAIKILKSFRVPEMEAYATVFGEKLGYVSDSVVLDKAIKITLKEREKLLDKLKNDMKEAKEKIKIYEEKYRNAESEYYKKSHHRQINRWQSKFETLKEILNFIEGDYK